MTKINLLISGPIRPNIDYINYLISRFKNLINYDIIIFLCYWKNTEIDQNLIKNVDYIIIEDEPEDKEIYKKITSRTIQQNDIYPKIEHWTPKIYKMFYGIKKMIEHIDNNLLIDDNDIVLRIRTDLYIDDCDFIKFNNLLNYIKKNTIYNRTRGCTCDWFSISFYNTFKKIWYIENDNQYNEIIKNLYNAEGIITYKSKLNNINIVDINDIIKLCICRKFKNDDDKKVQRFG